MHRIHVHESAESDLIGIWQYSFEQWGELQADKYLDQLDSGIRKLANNPEMGMKRDYVRDGYRVSASLEIAPKMTKSGSNRQSGTLLGAYRAKSILPSITVRSPLSTSRATLNASGNGQDR